ncbi:MAG: hypothetical protein HYZ53_02980 [Planctomycetes bacterium]|nr:hypothetical protein [Planctomycetota bacterium]
MLDTARFERDRRILGFLYPAGRTGEVPYAICGAVSEVRCKDIGVVVVEDGRLLDTTPKAGLERKGARTPGEELIRFLRQLGGFAALRMPESCPPISTLRELFYANEAGVRRFMAWSLAVDQFQLSLTLDPSRALAGARTRTEDGQPAGAESGATLAILAEEAARELGDFLTVETLKSMPGVTRRGAMFADPEYVVLDGMYLVASSQRSGFMLELERRRADLARKGLRLDSSGPCPPISFSPTLDQVLLPARPVITSVQRRMS